MKKLSKVVILGASCLLLAACRNANNSISDASTFKASIELTISSGDIKGKKDTDNDVLEWLGIPYATADRWQAPENVTKWSGTFDATEYGDVAIQLANGAVTGSEDALNLDVVRPDSEEADLPVIVYLHGGNNQTGSSQEIKGSSFVNDINAVYVSVNYRLGALGFNPLEALKTGTNEENSGNYSLLDIATALDWVEKNIETFGGDKDNVTLAGFSAGGRDVMATLISPLFEGKYDKAISFSGGMTLSDEAESQDIFATAIAPLVVEDGVKPTEEAAKAWLLTKGADVEDYLKGISAERLASLMGNAAIRMSVFPHLYKDGTVIPEEGFDTETYNDVPLMLVTGKNEFSLFAAYDNRFASDFTSGELFADEEKLAEFTYVKRYGGQLYRLANGVESARTISDKYSSDIYIGEIAYGDNSEVTPDLARTFGAFHGIFEPMLQIPSNYATIIGDAFETEGTATMSADFKAYLKHFLASGNPNADGLTEWEAWTSANQVLSIDASTDSAQIKSSADTDTASDILEAMSADTSLSEETKKELDTTVLNGRWFSLAIDEKYDEE
ncbi:carboxylesterase [Streptococcus gallolyticus]|uniref:Carboxylic ester hydrolase n=1 Tax=Streptococcus gallolyticus TaxID=315405 RepID=A0A368UBR8_9STRE|nr:carboxylesterase family protein [Streptococcus gallolyticus]RCW16410.1 carboxylesterase [Streptococcus gallolyticus]